jgi:hypothetical protein
LREPLCKDLQIAGDSLKEVVEVMRDAASQLADGFHFLRLPQRRLGRRQD